MKSISFVFVSLAMVVITAYCLSSDSQTLNENVERKTIVQGNSEFALELYARLSDEGENLFFSPYSISTALAMAYAGARGQTGSQMAQVLHFPTYLSPVDILATKKQEKTRVPLKYEQFSSAFGKVIKDLNTRGKKGKYELAVANALWGQKGYGFLEEFLNSIKTDYDGCLNEVDFATAVETARQTINTWVEEKTNNKIKDLIARGVLDSMTRLVLTNAIYFKSKWASQFKEQNTKQAPFTMLNGSKVDVPMMNQTADFNYIETENFQGLELPYVDNELSMIILLPKKFDGLATFEKTLTLENISGWLAKRRRCEVVVSIPKFKMTSQFSLADILKSMGIKDAFTPDVADFSGINGKRDLFISAVIHKAYVDVSEEGTEAAAATGVIMRVTSAVPRQMPVFRADHPFVFVIRDNHSGGLLFVGRVLDPLKWILV